MKLKTISTIILSVLLWMVTAVTCQAEWVGAEVTAYTHTGCVTASGEWPYEGGVACNFVPLGTIIIIDGVRYVVNDRSGAPGIIDVFMNSYDACINFGRQYKQVYIER